jgi:hypothetical protein
MKKESKIENIFETMKKTSYIDGLNYHIASDNQVFQNSFFTTCNIW